MRRLPLLILPLMLSAAPLHAQETGELPPEGIAANLNDPAVQDRVADTVAVMLEALMQINVGPLADIIAKAKPASDAQNLPRDATLGEIIGRDGADARLAGDQLRSGARMAGSAASILGAYLPVLSEMARDMAAQVDQNVRNPVK